MVGALEGQGPDVFAAVIGLEVGQDGQIYVLDRQANELRIFSPEGSSLRSSGRTGAGPGEYTNANGLLWIDPDTLLVVDQPGNRYSILTREGEYVRSVSRQLPFYGWAFDGGYHNGKVYERWIVERGQEEERPAYLGTDLRDSNAAIDTVLLPMPGASPSEDFSLRSDAGGMVISVPFAPQAFYYLDTTGSIWLAHGGEFRITKLSFEQDTILQIDQDAEPVPVTDDEIAEWESSSTVSRFVSMGGRIDRDRIPRVKPFLDGLALDTETNLWVALPSESMQIAFAVFDDQGRYLGRLEVQGISRDPYVRPVIRNGKLYVVGRDDLDVQRIYVYDIAK